MTFRRVTRRLIDKPQFAVEPNGIVLQWKDSPPSPCLSIYVGKMLANELGIRAFRAGRAQLFIGTDADRGKCGLTSVSGADGDLRLSGNRFAHIVHLPSHISVEHFSWCERTAIHRDQIEIREDMLIFAYAGIKG